MTMRFLTIILTALLIAATNPLARADEPVRVGVLRSARSNHADEVIAGFQKRMAEAGVAVDLQAVSEPFDAQAIARLSSFGPDVILALGPGPVEVAARELAGFPVVGTLVLRESDLPRNANTTGVVLEIPAATQFAWSTKLLPGQRRVGVVYNPEQNQTVVAELREAAHAAGMELTARAITTPGEIPAALETMRREADVLWGIPDRIFLTPQTAESILLYTIRNRIPFVGVSAPWVQAGAIYALDPNYPDLGAQCADLALRILLGESPSSIPPEHPRKVTYTVNERTARLMKVAVGPNAIADAREVLR